MVCTVGVSLVIKSGGTSPALNLFRSVRFTTSRLSGLVSVPLKDLAVEFPKNGLTFPVTPKVKFPFEARDVISYFV